MWTERWAEQFLPSWDTVPVSQSIDSVLTELSWHIPNIKFSQNFFRVVKVKKDITIFPLFYALNMDQWP
jgi:hypothetical protein